MARVIFMCGPAGSGKSTRARRLETDGWVRLSADAEAWKQGYRTMPIPEQASRQIMSDLRQRLVELVRADAHVVLDLSFWSRRMREEWREFLAPLGVVPEVIYVRVDRETALSRIRARAATHADDFTLPEHVAELYVDHFEVPSEQEGPLLVVDGKG